MPARGFFPRGRVRLGVLEAPKGLPLGYYLLDCPTRHAVLAETPQVRRCEPAPTLAFEPPGAFGLYVGPLRLGEGLSVFRTRAHRTLLLILGPETALALLGASPIPPEGG